MGSIILSCLLAILPVVVLVVLYLKTRSTADRIVVFLLILIYGYCVYMFVMQDVLITKEEKLQQLKDTYKKDSLRVESEFYILKSLPERE